MMLPSARIVVIDDEVRHVQAIVEALNVLETSAVGIHYTLETKLPRFPCLRILFLDLHLLPGAGSTEQQVKYTVDLLSQLLTYSNGPYAIILWSGHAKEAQLFENILGERLPDLEITAPLKIVPLNKVDHLADDEVKDPNRLRDAVLTKIQENPQLAALLAWEEHVAQAVNDTICQIFQMARQGTAEAAAGLNRILGELAIESAGRENATDNVFRATNEVLVQIVSDRLLHRTARGDLGPLWQKAVTIRESKDSALTFEESVRLNRLLHLEEGNFEPWRRGSVVNISSLTERQFIGVWGSSKKTTLEAFDRQKIGIDPADWMMIQVRSPCDEAQQNKGLLPFVLGIVISNGGKDDKWIEDAGRCEYLWLSPALPAKKEGSVMYLALHLRFVAGLSAEKVKRLRLESEYRLREPILEAISQKLHSYSDRPGIISFRQKRPRKK